MDLIHAVTVYQIAVLFGLLCFSAFFSGTETSLFSLSSLRLKRMQMTGARGVRHIEALLANPGALLITIVVGNMLVNVLASSIAASLFIRYMGPSGLEVSIPLMSVLIIIFGEIVPKIIAIKHAARFSLAMAPLITAFGKAVYPVQWILSRIVARVVSILPVRLKKEEAAITKDELETAVRRSYTDDGILDKDEGKMMEDVLEFEKTQVRQVMQPWANVVSFPITVPPDTVCFAIKSVEFSRFPIYEGERTNIIGMLYTKDLIKARVETKEFDIRSILRPPFFIADDAPVGFLMRELRSRKIHFALVRGSDGGMAGFVTLEDLVEEIIGEIKDKEALIAKIRDRTKG